MDNVIDINSRIPSNSFTCECGSAWFMLKGNKDIAENGAVCVTQEGSVTGYHGDLFCLECGKPGPSSPPMFYSY